MRPRREVRTQAQVVEHVCHHSSLHRVCPMYASDCPTLDGPREHVRVFGVVASREHDTVKLVQSTYGFIKALGTNGAVNWQRSPFPVEGPRTVCEPIGTFEDLQRALYSELGVGYEDVMLFVPGFKYSVKYSAKAAATLQRKVPFLATTCCFFSLNCSQGGSWDNSGGCTSPLHACGVLTCCYALADRVCKVRLVRF